MRKKILTAVLCVMVIGLFPVVNSAAGEEDEDSGATSVYTAQIEGEIKAGTLQYVRRAVRVAEEKKADYLVLKLDTPGGLVQATREIVDILLVADMDTVVYANKPGGWAYSAGTFILMGADYAVVHPGASIGAAEPRLLGGETVGEDPKLTEGMVSWIRSLAEIHGREADVAERFVTENLTLTGSEALEEGVIDFTATDLDDLFGHLEVADYDTVAVEMTLANRFFDWLSHPYLISLFLTAGALGILFAFRTGELEVSGVIGLLLLLIGLWGMGIISFNLLGLLLLCTGVILFVIELFVEPGFGIFGVFGVVAILLGVFTLEAEPFFAPRIFDAAAMMAVGGAIALWLFFVIMGRGVAASLRLKPVTGPESLIGSHAEVITELDPDGQVKFQGQTWRARSIVDSPINVGTKVEIVKVEGNTLVVKSI